MFAYSTSRSAIIYNNNPSLEQYCMGVPAFFRWLSRKYKSLITFAHEEKPREVNGIKVCQRKGWKLMIFKLSMIPESNLNF